MSFLSFSEPSLPCKFVDESHCTWSFYHLFGHVRCRIGNPRIKLNASFLCLIHWRIREDSRFSQPCFINLLFHFQWPEKETPTLLMTVDAQCSSKTGGEPPFLMVRLDHVRSPSWMVNPSLVQSPSHRRCLALIVCWAKWRWRWSSSKRPSAHPNDTKHGHGHMWFYLQRPPWFLEGCFVYYYYIIIILILIIINY